MLPYTNQCHQNGNSLNCTTRKGSYTLRRTSTSSFEGGSLNGPGRVLLISLKHTRSNTIHKYMCTCLHFKHRYIRLRLLQNWNWIDLREASMFSYLYTSRMAQYKSCTPSSWFSLVLANRSQMRSIIVFTCGWHFSLAETTINATWHQWASPFRLLYWLYSQNKQIKQDAPDLNNIWIGPWLLRTNALLIAPQFSPRTYCLTHTIEGQNMHIGDTIAYVVVGFFFHTIAQAQSSSGLYCSHVDTYSWVV